MDGLFSLTEKTAVVTGALGLLGREHCHALAEAGAHVIVTDLDDNGCDEFAEDLTADHQVTAIGIGVDITDPSSILALRDYVLQQFGHLDVLVNNAAINDMVEKKSEQEKSRFESFPLDLWKKSIDVNVTGTFNCCQIIGKGMAEQGSGSIINIASTYGIVAPDQSLYRKADGSQTFYKSPAYPVTKGAVLAFTRYLAAYWGEKGVRVNALSPGGVKNGQDEEFLERYSRRTPLQRMAQPSDYRGAIVFLASDSSRYMTGANLVVDGGWTIW